MKIIDSFNIDDLSPFFKHTFKIEIPYNLIPESLSVDDLGLSKKDSEDFIEAKKFPHNRWFKRLKARIRKEEDTVNLSLEDQSKDKTYKRVISELDRRNKILTRLYLKNDLSQDRIIAIRKKNRIAVSPIIYWLANEIGREHQFRGLTSETLKQLPEGVFQIGQEDSNSKGYFIYTSTSAKRRVRLRFVLWDQYDIELYRSSERLDSLQRFFQNFKNFEKEIEESIATLFLFYDEFTGTEINIHLKNGKRIIKEKRFWGRHVRWL